MSSWQMARSGLLTATASLAAQDEDVAAESAAGAPADWPLTRFGHFNGAIARNGAALGDVVSAEVTYANNLDRIETIRADGRIDGADPAMAALTGRIEVRFAGQALLAQAIEGAPCTLEFGWAAPSRESLTVAVHAVFLPRPKLEIAGPQGVQASFDWQAARDAAEGCMATITLVNDVASYELGAATAPAAFAAGDWSVADQPSAGGDRLTLTVAGLPASGGSAITALQWRVGGGAAATLGGTTAGAYAITVLAGTAASVEIRAVNAVGAAPWSAAKTATPTETAAGPALTLAPVWKRHLSDASSSLYARADAAGTLYLASLETPPASGAALEGAAVWSGAVTAGADMELTATGLVGPISTVHAVVKSADGAHGPVVAIPRNSNVGKFVTDLPSGLVGVAGGISGNLRLGSGGSFRWSVFAAPRLMISAQQIIDGALSPLATGTDPIVTANATQPFAVTGLAPGDHVLFVTSLSGTGVIGETWRVPFTST